MLGKPLLFLSSYAPLFGLLAIRFSDWRVSGVCYTLAAIGLISLPVLLRLGQRTSPSPHRLASVRNAGSEAGAYLAGYLLPFLTISTPTLRDVIAYSLFIVVVAAVTLRTSVMQVNPLLYLLGYSVFEVRDDKGLVAYLVSRTKVSPGDEVLASRLADDVLIAK